MKEIVYPFALSAIRYLVAGYGGAHIVKGGLDDQLAGAFTILICIGISWLERWWNKKKK